MAAIRVTLFTEEVIFLYSNALSMTDFIAYIIVLGLIFTIHIYKEKVKENRERIARLEEENSKLREAVSFYHDKVSREFD
ncbi:hypothetical protein [Alkalihalobacillus sp. CinArs1]|uniref:hypothetical protein n=1 Tax=Alkalihalobacillus sp. CinArs1 TaxID=2995314 RepID=UPI0022DE93AE|nr:hypothetical protein [Alkalihalobacillus sp. CinArs1]